MPESRSPRPTTRARRKGGEGVLSTASAACAMCPALRETRKREGRSNQTRLPDESSNEALRAGQLQTVALIFDPLILSHTRARPKPSGNTLNAILKTLAAEDIALLVVAADSMTRCRGQRLTLSSCQRFPTRRRHRNGLGLGFPSQRASPRRRIGIMLRLPRRRIDAS